MKYVVWNSCCNSDLFCCDNRASAEELILSIAEEDDFVEAPDQYRVRSTYEKPQGAREGFPHAPPYHQRAYASARPAALFPTNEVVALLSAINGMKGGSANIAAKGASIPRCWPRATSTRSGASRAMPA